MDPTVLNAKESPISLWLVQELRGRMHGRGLTATHAMGDAAQVAMWNDAKVDVFPPVGGPALSAIARAPMTEGEVPAGEIWFYDEHGVVGKIVNLGVA